MGIQRKIDDLGRVVIPPSIREEAGIEPGQYADVILLDGDIIIRKSGIRCKLCYSAARESLNYMKSTDQYICDDCLSRIKEDFKGRL